LFARGGNVSKFRSYLLNAGLIAVVFFGGLAFQSRNMIAADGQAAPELRGTTLGGQLYDLENAAGRRSSTSSHRGASSARPVPAT
jgi:hypothetical protein